MDSLKGFMIVGANTKHIQPMNDAQMIRFPEIVELVDTYPWYTRPLTWLVPPLLEKGPGTFDIV